MYSPLLLTPFNLHRQLCIPRDMAWFSVCYTYYYHQHQTTLMLTTDRQSKRGCADDVLFVMLGYAQVNERANVTLFLDYGECTALSFTLPHVCCMLLLLLFYKANRREEEPTQVFFAHCGCALHFTLVRARKKHSFIVCFGHAH